MRGSVAILSGVLALASGVAAAEESEGLKNADHWSFQPLRKVSPPPSEEANSLDAFIFARLAEQKLGPNPPAARAALIRRMTFDLHGLPPTPEEIEAFVSDPAGDDEAVRKLIARLLAFLPVGGCPPRGLIGRSGSLVRAPAFSQFGKKEDTSEWSAATAA